ncbi:MAG: hypothetical protein GY782_00485 [Gammaproteobacteria bacterium]|nr:hypothetical protein [Gammaproteobacteria bacterium]
MLGKEKKEGKKNSLEERLKAHPHLREKFERILNIVENAHGDLEKADDAEQRAIEELRKLGNEVLHDWAIHQEKKKAEGMNTNKSKVKKHGKKNFIGIPDLDK